MNLTNHLDWMGWIMIMTLPPTPTDEEADHNGFPKTSHHARKSNSLDIGTAPLTRSVSAPLLWLFLHLLCYRVHALEYMCIFHYSCSEQYHNSFYFLFIPNEISMGLSFDVLPSLQIVLDVTPCFTFTPQPHFFVVVLFPHPQCVCLSWHFPS